MERGGGPLPGFSVKLVSQTFEEGGGYIKVVSRKLPSDAEADNLQLYSGYFLYILANYGYFQTLVWLILSNPGYSWILLTNLGYFLANPR